MGNIRINGRQWEAISPDEQIKIVDGLVQVGSMKAGEKIVGDEAIAPFNPDRGIKLEWNPVKDACGILCDTAAGTAAAWCSANTAGAGLVACLAAAEAARQKCRDGC